MHRLPRPAHMPCERCGASVATAAADAHECDDERRLDYALFGLRDEIGAFEEALHSWLETPAGRFARFYAERRRAD